MKAIIILSIGLISTINASKRLLQQESCGDNEEYNQCGSACPAKCGDSPSQICIQQCVAGCFCKKGFILNEENGKCIPENGCPCGVNEVYNQCGTACRAKCGDDPESICNLQCVEGCFCKDGYILDKENGNCIPKNECPTCGDNKEYNICGTACPAKCGDSETSICTSQCVEGCFCKEGYILDVKDGNCIPENECPIELPIGIYLFIYCIFSF